MWAEWVAPVVLAVAFAFAGGAKLADRQATAAGFDALGLSHPNQRAIQVPTVELSTAVVLLVAPVGGAVLVLLLLGLFSWFLVRRLRSGSTAPCLCFGAVRTRPISWLDLVRNAALGAVAIAVLAAPPG
jgi:Methylamine utilisation protein MauE